MKVAQTITVGGLENKDIAWECDRDGVTAELRHPVQLVHVNVGDIDAVAGRRRRLMHKEIRGAELVVYHEWLPPGAAAATIERGNAAKRAKSTGGSARARRPASSVRRRRSRRGGGR